MSFPRFPTPYNKEDSINWLYTALANEWTQTGLPFSLKQNITTYVSLCLTVAEMAHLRLENRSVLSFFRFFTQNHFGILIFKTKICFNRGAFYTIKLFDKLRLISLNTNYCPKENFWLFVNSTDPLDQLKWLAETLQLSEDNNEKVYLRCSYENLKQFFLIFD